MSKDFFRPSSSIVYMVQLAQGVVTPRCYRAPWLFLFAIAGVVLLLIVRQGVAIAQNHSYSLTWWTIASGGASGNQQSTGGVYALEGSIGQSDVSVLTGDTYALAGGFWQQLTVPQGSGDYEPDNACTQATDIPVDGTVQRHGFEVAQDADWVKFNAIAGARYVVEANRLPTSTADVVIAVYTDCGTLSETQAYTYTPDVLLEFPAPATGPILLKLTNNDPASAGANVRYTLTVRQVNTAPTVSALIVAAGRLKSDDSLQANIYHITDEVYRLFKQQTYTDDQIYYLAPDINHQAKDIKVDATATVTNLQNAITQWAKQQVGAQGALTLYLMDHGAKGKFYLDAVNNQEITPSQLSAWLSELESAKPGIKINVIIEMCYAGSFIKDASQLNKAGRVMIASTSDSFVAWASTQGAIFSDHLLDALRRKSSLGMSFTRAREAALAFHQAQSPWLDADGDGTPNEADDIDMANRRSFDILGSLGELWPPYIAQVEPPTAIVDHQGSLRAEVLDDKAVKHVWAMIYPPDYTIPATSEALISDEADERVTKLGLTRRSDGLYSANFTGFNQIGAYRVVIYAEDDEGLQAQPVALTVTVGNEQVRRLFLPLVVR